MSCTDEEKGEIQHHSSARKGGTGSAHSCIKLCATEISLHVFIITTTTTLGVPQHLITQETMWAWVASQNPKGTMRSPLSSSSPPHQKSVMMISKKIRLVLKTFKMVRKLMISEQNLSSQYFFRVLGKRGAS